MTVDDTERAMVAKELRGYLARRAAELARLGSRPSPSVVRSIMDELASLGYATLVDESLVEVVITELAAASPSLATLMLSHTYATWQLVGMASPTSPTSSALPSLATEDNPWLASRLYQGDLDQHLGLVLPEGIDGPLAGTASLVVGAPLARQLVLVARDPEGAAVLVAVETRSLELSSEVATLGLQGALTCDVTLARSAHDGFRVVATGTPCLSRLAEARAALAPLAGRLLGSLLSEACRVARDYADTRIQGHRRVAEHPQVQELLSLIDLGVALAQVASKRDGSLGTPSTLRLLGPHARRAANAALQVFGGSGYMVGAPVEQLYRDIIQATVLLG